MNKISIKKMHIFFIIFMLSYVGLSLLVSVILPADMSAYLVMLISEGVIIAPVLAYMYIVKISVSEVFRYKISIADMLLGMIGAVSLLPLIYLINYVTMLFAKNYVGEMMLDIFEYPLFLQLILMALMPALVEEFIFRGLFYGVYSKKSIIKGGIMSGLVFGLAHMNVNQFAYAFVIGIAFSLFYAASGNILVPIAAHFTINSSTVLMTWLSEDAGSVIESASTAPLAIMPMGVIMCMIAVLGAIAVLGMGAYIAVLLKLAKRNERHDYLIAGIREGFKRADESYINIYFWLAFVPVIAYMILIEL